MTFDEALALGGGVQPQSLKVGNKTTAFNPDDLEDGAHIIWKNGAEVIYHDDGTYDKVADAKTAGGKTAPQITLPTDGTPLQRATAIRDSVLGRYNDANTPETEKAGLLALLQQQEQQINSLSKADKPKMDPNDPVTKALAQAAVAKGSSASQSELEAYFAIHGGTAAGQPSQYVMPIAGYTGGIGPHHDGKTELPGGAVDLKAPVGTPVQAIEDGVVVSTEPYTDHGSGSGTGFNVLWKGFNSNNYYWYQHLAEDPGLKPGDTFEKGQQLGRVGQTGYDPSAAPAHLHLGISKTINGLAGNGFNTTGEGTGVDAPGFLKSIASGQQPGDTSGGANPFAPKPEIHALGNKLYQHNPDGTWSVAIDGSQFAAPTTHVIGNTLYQYDPATQQWQQKIQGPLSPTEQQAQDGKFKTLITQAQSTKDYIQQQLASGSMTPAQADQYMGQLNDYTSAALQGTTPWERYNAQQQMDIQRQTVAKDLLDTKMQQSSQMASSILGDSIRAVSGTKYATVAPGTFSGIFQGALDTANQQAKPLTDLAQQLLSSVGQRAAAAGLNPRLPGLSGVNDPNPVAASPDQVAA